MTFCIYLTHPQVEIDPTIPVPDWGLSEVGANRAALAMKQPWADSIRHVISSTERKAMETAQIFAAAFHLSPLYPEGLHENDRSATGFLPPDEFETTADLFFAHPEQSIKGWEPAREAQNRIVSAITSCLARIPENDAVLFTGHGGVGTLLKCHLLGTPISRKFDQKGGGGCWYRFMKSDLMAQSATNLDWTPL